MNFMIRFVYLATLLAFHAVSQADIVTWIGPETGDWNDAANWSTGAVPTEFDTVFIDANAGQASVVTASAATPSTGDVFVAAADSLEVLELDVTSLSLAGDVSVVPSGELTIRSTDTVIEPTGHLEVDGTLAYEGSFPAVNRLLWNQGTLSGIGDLAIRAQILNDGLIQNNVAEETLDLSFTTTSSNSGLIQASSGGSIGLRWSSGNDNRIANQMGTIEALAGSTVSFENLTIQGGIVRSVGDGMITAEVSEFEDVEFSGKMEATRSALVGNTKNTGEVVLLGGYNFLWGTLTGGGIIQLGTGMFDQAAVQVGFADNPPPGNSGSLTNQDNLIRGHGILGTNNSGILHNYGTIEAGLADEGPLNRTLYVLVFTNNHGVLRATTRHVLSLSDVLNTADGVIEAMPDSTVSVVGSSGNPLLIEGGTLRSVAANPGSGMADGIIELGNARLRNLKTEGNIGSFSSSFEPQGTIENNGRIIAGLITVRDDAEIVGGVIDLSNGGALSFERASFPPAELRLTDSQLLLGDRSGIVGEQGHRLISNGIITAVADARVTLNRAAIVNSGLIQVEPNARLAIQTIFNDSGVLYAAPGSRLELGIVSGGIIGCPTGQSCDAGFGDIIASRLENVTNDAYVFLNSASQDALQGSIVNNGRLDIRGDAELTSYVELLGSGETYLLDINFRFEESVLNSPDHTIRGGGELFFQNGNFLNQGTLLADDGQLLITTPTFGGIQQDGTLESRGTGFIDIIRQQQLVNRGRILAGGGGISLMETSILNLPGGEIYVESRLQLRTKLENAPGAVVGGDGDLVIFGGGTQESFLENSGIVAPGMSVGTLTLFGDYKQNASGTLQIDVDGFAEGEYDRLFIDVNVAGVFRSAELAGTLELQFAEGINPELGDSFTFLETNTNPLLRPEDPFTGQFETVVGLPTLAGGLAWSLVYEPTTVSAVVGLAGDYNGDGTVDLADYTLWRNQLGSDTFLSGDTTPGSVTEADYDVWRQNFGREIPDGTNNQTVPEPTAVWLLAAGAIVGMIISRGTNRWH